MHKSDEVRPSRLRMLTLGRCAKFPAWGETQALSLAIAPNQTVVHVDYCAAERPDPFKADHNREAVAERVGARHDPVDALFDIVVVRAPVGRVEILALDAQVVAPAADLLGEEQPDVRYGPAARLSP
jgi:hypothetical protein